MRNLILALGLSSVVFLAACGKKDEPAPPVEPTAPAMEEPAAEEAAPAMEEAAPEAEAPAAE
ncbi:hypothetical protein [Panacagrimonas sp.]|uniref:hypothetical protein n=1 Tax=Panacagrimonas sp. TaxID=2480088 RepID=UPI003B51B987